MRADQYIRLGAKLEKKTILFHGVVLGNNITLSEFDAIMTIDNSNYPIRIHVISETLIKHELLIAINFLNTVTINVEKIIINNLFRKIKKFSS